MGSVPRKESGGRDHWMRSTSGNEGKRDLVWGTEGLGWGGGREDWQA